MNDSFEQGGGDASDHAGPLKEAQANIEIGSFTPCESQESDVETPGSPRPLLECLKDLFRAGCPKAFLLGENTLGLTLEMSAGDMLELAPLLREHSRGWASRSANSHRHSRILIVEDDRVSRALLRKILERGDFTDITEATNGLIAWDLLQKGLFPDLCLLDVMMPELNGIDLLQKLRASPRFRTLPVIVCTVVNDREIVRKALALRVDYILKPFSADLLLDKVRRALTCETASILQRLRSAQARFGLEPDEYMDRLSALAQEIEILATSVRRSLAARQNSEALCLARQFKDECLKVGEERVWEIVEMVDRSIQGGKAGETIASLQLLERETLRLTRLVQAIWRNYLRAHG